MVVLATVAEEEGIDAVVALVRCVESSENDKRGVVSPLMGYPEVLVPMAVCEILPGIDPSPAGRRGSGGRELSDINLNLRVSPGTLIELKLVSVVETPAPSPPLPLGLAPPTLVVFSKLLMGLLLGTDLGLTFALVKLLLLLFIGALMRLVLLLLACFNGGFMLKFGLFADPLLMLTLLSLVGSLLMLLVLTRKLGVLALLKTGVFRAVAFALLPF